MNLKDRINGILGDHLPNSKEVEGITEHLMFFCYKKLRKSFIIGVVVGMGILALILAYFS
jgi:hypothetical protein